DLLVALDGRVFEAKLHLATLAVVVARKFLPARLVAEGLEGLAELLRVEGEGVNDRLALLGQLVEDPQAVAPAQVPRGIHPPNQESSRHLREAIAEVPTEHLTERAGHRASYLRRELA